MRRGANPVDEDIQGVLDCAGLLGLGQAGQRPVEEERSEAVQRRPERNGSQFAAGRLVDDADGDELVKRIGAPARGEKQHGGRSNIGATGKVGAPTMLLRRE
jgi:hypothetical protein